MARALWTVVKYVLAALGAYLLLGLWFQRSDPQYWLDIWR
jgi:hypothetical protein